VVAPPAATRNVKAFWGEGKTRSNVVWEMTTFLKSGSIWGGW
jgi:hypothetical protein